MHNSSCWLKESHWVDYSPLYYFILMDFPSCVVLNVNLMFPTPISHQSSSLRRYTRCRSTHCFCPFVSCDFISRPILNLEASRCVDNALWNCVCTRSNFKRQNLFGALLILLSASHTVYFLSFLWLGNISAGAHHSKTSIFQAIVFSTLECRRKSSDGGHVGNIRHPMKL